VVKGDFYLIAAQAAGLRMCLRFSSPLHPFRDKLCDLRRYPEVRLGGVTTVVGPPVRDCHSPLR
jgi:hypothetical protein